MRNLFQLDPVQRCSPREARRFGLLIFKESLEFSFDSFIPCEQHCSRLEKPRISLVSLPLLVLGPHGFMDDSKILHLVLPFDDTFYEPGTVA